MGLNMSVETTKKVNTVIKESKILYDLRPIFRNAFTFTGKGENDFRLWLYSEYGIRYRLSYDRKSLNVISYNDEELYLIFLLKFA